MWKPAPPSFRTGGHILDVPTLIARFHQVEAQLTQLDLRLQEPLTPRDRAGAHAHKASLLRKRAWYLGRLRAQKPVSGVDVGVHDPVAAGEALQ